MEPTAELTPVEGIRRHLRRGVRRYITGSAHGASALPADDGWFGPDSITWLVQTDWAVLIGGVESLLVQTLHPPTMAGVADHSDYRNDAFGRLHRTAAFIGKTTFGSAEHAQRAVDQVRAIHERIEGTTPDGVPYRANDPRNLGWVHATEVDGFLRAFRRFGNTPITDAEADRYVAEMARVGEAMGVEDAPRSVAELQSTLRSYKDELKVSAQSREALRFLINPPNALAVKPAHTIVLSGAVSIMPNWARRLLWIPPAIPPIDKALFEPPTRVLLKTLDWIMDAPPEVQKLRDRRSA
jgi:uncharacterized protein (DUF2236 family)